MKEQFAEPLKDYIRRTCVNQRKFALLHGFNECSVSLMVKRGDVVIDGVRFMPVGDPLKCGK